MAKRKTPAPKTPKTSTKAVDVQALDQLTAKLEALKSGLGNGIVVTAAELDGMLATVEQIKDEISTPPAPK